VGAKFGREDIGVEEELDAGSFELLNLQF